MLICYAYAIVNHKKWYNLAAHRHNVNVLQSNITKL